MVNNMLDNTEIEEIMKELNISKEQAESLVQSHDTFLTKLSDVKDVGFSLTLILTTAISIASVENIPPATFMQLIVDVMEACSQDPKPPTFVADA